MHPAFRIALAVVGAVFAADLAGAGAHFLAAVVGALLGLGIGEVIALRNSLAKLEAELEVLRGAQSPPREQAPGTRAAPQPAEGARRPATQELSEVPPVRIPPAARPGIERPSPIVETRDSIPRATDRPATPAPESPILTLLREYFTGGNTLVRAGAVVLFFGVAFLLRYVAEHSHIPIEVRLSAVAAGALALLALGWRLRTRRAGYALALQGCAVGILYLTVFFALHVYSLLTPGAAFVLLAVLSALTAALAVLQDSLAFALLGVTGAFLAPFLASTGEGNHVLLFSYFAVLNAAILIIAWFRAWRLLNLAGFAFTFVLSTVWGVLSYRPEEFATTEPFLVLFFLLYVAIAVLYSTRRAPASQNYIDATIIFGTPIATFGLQAAMLSEHRLALAYSALAMSALYLALAWIVYRRRGESQRLLVEAFTALGVAFLTLAVPLALNGRWSAASWALEGAALTWVGCRQNRRLPRAFGALLQFAAGGALLLTLSSGGAIPPGTYIAALLVGIASVYAARMLQTNGAQLEEYEWTLSGLLFFWGLLWWCIGGFGELGQHIDKPYRLSAALVFATLTALLSSEIASRARMRVAMAAALALLPAMLFFALWAGSSQSHAFAYGGWASWPLAFAGLYFILRRQDGVAPPGLANLLHAAALWLGTALLSWEVAWVISRTVGNSGAWSSIAWGVVPALVLAASPHAAARLGWPPKAQRMAYLLLASAGLGMYLGVWSVETNLVISSPSAPLPYLPLANPLDIAQGFVLYVLIRFCARLGSDALLTAAGSAQRAAGVAIAALGFIWVNAMLLRTLHQWAGIPYELQAMVDSTLVQSALSICWAFLALTTMLVATRIKMRAVWLAGAALLVVDVAKLFLVDLSSVGTVERIISFVGVGLLMLVLGYFSPLPPAAEETR